MHRLLPLMLFLLASNYAQAIGVYGVFVQAFIPGQFGEECGSNEPALMCAGTDTSITQNFTGGGFTAFGSSNLNNGSVNGQTFTGAPARISASGPTYQAGANARWEESLVFSGVAAGTVQKLGISISVSGTYVDGSFVSFSTFNQSGDYFGMVSGFDLLNADYAYTGNGQANPSDSTSGQPTRDAGSACATCFSSSSGDWTSAGPTLFAGEIDIFGDNPLVDLSMSLSGSGAFNFANSAIITLTVPEGVTFTSSSGVFLEPTPVPVPATTWLFGSALGLLGWTKRKTA